MSGIGFGSGPRAVLLATMILAMSLSDISVLSEESSNTTAGRSDAPTLPLYRMLIGDEWLYDTQLDAEALIDPDDPEWYGASIPQPLTGETLRVVESITEFEHLGANQTVYVVRTSGTYGGEGTFPAPVLGLVNGIIEVRFERTEWIRLSDMATLVQETDLYIALDHLAGTELLTDIISRWSFEPDAEFYDFPLGSHEQWTSAYLRNESWTGDKGYFSPPEKERNIERAFNVTAYSQPPISWTGCEMAYNVSQTDAEGEPTEYRWLCPAVRGALIEWHADIILGAPARLQLKSFAAGEPSQNSLETLIDDDLDLDNMTLGQPLLFTIWLNDSAGSPMPGESVLVNYLNRTRNFTTDQNGSVMINISAGVQKDTTPTRYDWGSHGVVITHPSSSTHAVFTVVLNSSAIAEGIALRVAGMEKVDGWVIGSFTLATQFADQMRW